MNNSGIYTITNKSNNKKYIGYATNLENTKEITFEQLKDNKYHNEELQEDYNKGDCFNFDVIKLVYPDHDLLHYERYLEYEKMINSGVKTYNNNSVQPGIMKQQHIKDKIIDLYCLERFGKTYSQIFSFTCDIEDHMYYQILSKDPAEESNIREYFEPIIKFRRKEINREIRDRQRSK